METDSVYSMSWWLKGIGRHSLVVVVLWCLHMTIAVLVLKNGWILFLLPLVLASLVLLLSTCLLGALIVFTCRQRVPPSALAKFALRLKQGLLSLFYLAMIAFFLYDIYSQI